MEQIQIVIEGRVQGVGFRYATQEKALSLGLTGWVRNTRDGKVEALVEGYTGEVTQFIQWCNQGPALARVLNVKILNQTSLDKNTFESFDIRH